MNSMALELVHQHWRPRIHLLTIFY